MSKMSCGWPISMRDRVRPLPTPPEITALTARVEKIKAEAERACAGLPNDLDPSEVFIVMTEVARVLATQSTAADG